MKRACALLILTGVAVVFVASTGVERAAADEKAAAKGTVLTLAGLTLTAPADWKAQKVERPGPMSPKAVFTIPAIEGDSQTGMVRITHFPKMKGMDEMNVNRWLGQVQQENGRASTRDNAKISEKTIGDVKLTIVDVSGSVRVTMRDTPHPGNRMIAAIVNHPEGPHFVVVAGSAKLMEKNEKAILGFIESAKVAANGKSDPHAGHGH